MAAKKTAKRKPLKKTRRSPRRRSYSAMAEEAAYQARHEGGFAGSPDHHANLADKAVDDVVAYAQEAQRLTQLGRCGDAIAELQRMHKKVGYISAHVVESERPKLGVDLLAHYDHEMATAEYAFAKKCIVKKARR